MVSKCSERVLFGRLAEEDKEKTEESLKEFEIAGKPRDIASAWTLLTRSEELICCCGVACASCSACQISTRGAWRLVSSSNALCRAERRLVLTWNLCFGSQNSNADVLCIEEVLFIDGPREVLLFMEDVLCIEEVLFIDGPREVLLMEDV